MHAADRGSIPGLPQLPREPPSALQSVAKNTTKSSAGHFPLVRHQTGRTGQLLPICGARSFLRSCHHPFTYWSGSGTHSMWTRMDTPEQDSRAGPALCQLEMPLFTRPCLSRETWRRPLPSLAAGLFRGDSWGVPNMDKGSPSPQEIESSGHVFTL